MAPTPSPGCCGITRRGLLLGAAAGLAAGAPLGWFGSRRWQERQPASPSSGPAEARPRADHAMPGPFRGRVVEVRHPDAVRPDHSINAAAVDAMVDRGMTSLTGADAPEEAWRRLFGPDDVVGIKVNPVGRRPLPGETDRHPRAVGSISNPEVILKVVEGLKSAGVKPGNILLFERYADQFVEAGYDRLLTERSMDGVRWAASAAQYTDTQLDLAGFDRGRDRYSPDLARHVVGYDPDVSVFMGFASPQHDPKDERRFHSHLSAIVTRVCSKVINLPVLKDHRSAGVTLALKNLSHGMNNNVARSHLSGPEFERGGAASGPNQCNTFIPTAVSHLALREKVTLHVLDGLIGVYEGGPGSWNRTWATWHHQGLFFATDPVALDLVGWQIIDARRAAEGWRPVGEMGLLHHTPAVQAAADLTAVAARGLPDALTLQAAAQHVQLGRRSESFDRRQPEHVLLAGTLGLGEYDHRKIRHQLISLPA